MSRSLNVLFTTWIRRIRPSIYVQSKHTLQPAGCRVLHRRGITMDSYTENTTTFDDLESKSFSPDEYFDCAPLLRRKSTIEDEQRLVLLLKDILTYKDKHFSSWIVENNVKDAVGLYKLLTKNQKQSFLKILATDYSVDHERIYKTMNQLKEMEPGSAVSLKAEEQLKSVLTPQYSWLFKYIGRLENGVKFLVDMRTDLLDLLAVMDNRSEEYLPLQQLNSSLQELLSLWFSVGFLKLERVTWKSPCEMLQKISEYEAVHPVRSWADLKRRVGSYRRCFVFTHSSMPSEPIVVLHTSLSTEIASTMRGIVTAAQRMSSLFLFMRINTRCTLFLLFKLLEKVSVDASSKESLLSSEDMEDPDIVTAAVFYSISSTQRGLQGIELGNYLIKRVVRELQAEFPRVNQFSTLSPIPGFKVWLLEKIKVFSKGDESGWGWEGVAKHVGGWQELRRSLQNNSWREDSVLVDLLEPLLMSACSHYLYKEKRRGAALCSVANFHSKNGAMMWRLNWLADMSPRGLTNSCGIMVNYRYFLEDLEKNSQNYIENKVVNASDQIKQLVGERIPSKM